MNTIDLIRRALPKRELRVFRGGVEYRAAGATSAAPPKIAMRIPFNSKSADLGFTELVGDTAFDRMLQSKLDVAALWNHESSWVLGRVSNRTLSLSKTASALEATVTLDPNNTMHMGSFAPMVQRGDIRGASFGFEVPKGGDSWEYGRDGSVTRTLLDLTVFDISPVCFPAYPESEAEARALISSLLGAHRHPSLAERTMALRDRELAWRERQLAAWDAAARR